VHHLTPGADLIEGWQVQRTLGEGTFGTVSLLMNERGEATAVKVVDLVNAAAIAHSTIETQRIAMQKEVAILEAIKTELEQPCEHVIKLFAHRQEDNMFYIFLEYADGGELFDRIGA
jgi:serine/threonine-protein kinase Chk1